MKKFPALIALVLTLVMLMIPMGAMAEPTTAPVIQVANPSVTAFGETRSMPGLALQLALCESSDASLAQIIADVIVNNQNATSAMIQIDSLSNIVALLGGMSNAYTVNMNDLAAMPEASASADVSQLVNEIERLALAIESWTLPNDISQIVATHSADFTVTESFETDAEGREMSYVNFQGDVTNMIVDVLTAIDNDALITSVVQMLDPSMTSLGLVENIGIGNGNGLRVDATIGSDATGMYNTIATDIIVYSDGVDAGTFRILVDADLAQQAYSADIMMIDPSDAQIGSICADVVCHADGFTATVNCDFAGEIITLNANLDSIENLDSFTATLTETSPYSEESNTANIYYINNKTETSNSITAGFTATSYGDTTSATLFAETELTDTGFKANGTLALSDPYSGETVIALNDLTIDVVNGLLNFDFTYTDPYSGPTTILLNGSYAMTETGLTVSGKLVVTDSYGDTTISIDDLSIDMVNGGFNIAASYSDPFAGAQSFALSLVPTTPAEGAIYSAVLSGSIKDEYTDISASADVHLLNVDVDTANFYIDPVTAINLMTMDELQMETAETELMTVLSNLGQTIMNAYPAFFE